jgi:hypothetical protein
LVSSFSKGFPLALSLICVAVVRILKFLAETHARKASSDRLWRKIKVREIESHPLQDRRSKRQMDDDDDDDDDDYSKRDKAPLHSEHGPFPLRQRRSQTISCEMNSRTSTEGIATREFQSVPSMQDVQNGDCIHKIESAMVQCRRASSTKTQPRNRPYFRARRHPIQNTREPMSCQGHVVIASLPTEFPSEICVEILHKYVRNGTCILAAQGSVGNLCRNSTQIRTKWNVCSHASGSCLILQQRLLHNLNTDHFHESW